MEKSSSFNTSLTEGKPGPEHERLRAELEDWARIRGFTDLYSNLPFGGCPDVLRTTADRKYLFIGDAKNAENETCSRLDTHSRILGYAFAFASLLNKGYYGGYFAIATNDEIAVKDWVADLNDICRSAGISANGNPPDFKIDKINTDTWIAYW